jgi:hypothetical protein
MNGQIYTGKPRKYDQLKETILGLEAYHKYEMGEIEDANGRIP